jgi:hypothetical protein
MAWLLRLFLTKTSPMRILLFLIASSFFTISLHAQIDHSAWDAQLKKYVQSNGKVNYKAWKNDREGLHKYCEYLSANEPKKGTSPAARKAYWMNVYNAFTIKLVLEHYPVKSINDIGGLIKPWDIKFFKIGNKVLDLNFVEHKILRVQFNDPRIHVGINCASISCPRLSNIAFTESNVDAELEKLMKEFVNDPSKNRITSDKMELSEIFNWFESDFTKKQSLIDYLNKYSSVKINKSATKTHLPYNWNLNE